MSDTKIVVTFSNGEMWEFDAHIVANARAKYYAQLGVDRGDVEDYDEQYKAEYEYALGNDYELEDWASNNMNWSDVEPHARQIPGDHSIDRQREWTNADRKVRRG